MLAMASVRPGPEKIKRLFSNPPVVYGRRTRALRRKGDPPMVEQYLTPGLVIAVGVALWRLQ